MAKLGRPRTLFLAAIMAITASTAVSVLPAPVRAAPETPGSHASVAVGTSRAPTLKLVARPATAALSTGYDSLGSESSAPSGGAPSLCLSTYEGLNDETAVQYFCDGYNDQGWALGGEWGSTGFYQLINKNGSCLGVGGGSKAVYATVVGWTCSPTHPDQYWGFYQLYIGGVGSVLYAIRNLNSGYFLTVFQDQPYADAIIDQEPWQDANWQMWWPMAF